MDEITQMVKFLFLTTNFEILSVLSFLETTLLFFMIIHPN